MKVRNGNKILVGTPEGNTPIERIWRRWYDTIKVTLNKHGVRIYTGFKGLMIRSNNDILYAQ
jgi:hypothetical protein